MIKSLSIHLLSICFLALFPCMMCMGQTNEYNQISNEFQFTRTLTDKLATEVAINGDFSETPNESQILKTNIQRGINVYGHYQYSSRWKFSSFVARYYNKDVPDIGQYNANEWRFGLQGIYYIKKVGFTLSTRARAELRFLQNEEGLYEDIYRYRQLIKLMQPLNAKVLRQGVFYTMISEEVIFRSKVNTSGMAHFDRNRLTIGAGYVFTDDLQLELSYTNEYAPRDTGNQLYHIMGATLTINNFVPKVKKKLASMNLLPQSDE
jgi:hypothetical protein